MIFSNRFLKENGNWYIDLPEFIEKGYGTKANLMMVAGADTLLDKLSNNGNEINLNIAENTFVGVDDVLVKTSMGLDREYLKEVGHAQVEYGAYYRAKKMKHDLWLCPVTEYVFSGKYPDKIFNSVQGFKRLDN